MSAYRFYPLAEYPRTGLLKAPDGSVSKAKFLTPEQARAEAQQLQGIAA